MTKATKTVTSPTKLVVPRGKVAAARSQVKRDQLRGLPTDPRILAIANAKPAASTR